MSVSNQCNYCIASHTAAARKKGMTEAMFHELMAVVGMANETNRFPATSKQHSFTNWPRETYLSFQEFRSASFGSRRHFDA